MEVCRKLNRGVSVKCLKMCRVRYSLYVPFFCFKAFFDKAVKHLTKVLFED